MCIDIRPIGVDTYMAVTIIMPNERSHDHRGGSCDLSLSLIIIPVFIFLGLGASCWLGHDNLEKREREAPRHHVASYNTFTRLLNMPTIQ